MARTFTSIVALTLSLGACSFIDDFGKFEFQGDDMDARVDADGGTRADGCSVASDETCNGEDDDCDTRVDEQPTECGGPNELTACQAGTCTVSGCAEGWDDCDEGAAGCERDVTGDHGACGGCDTVCEATDACVDATCSSGEIGWSLLVPGVQWNAIAAGERALIAAGAFTGTVAVGSASVVSHGSEDALVTRVDEETGTPLWSRTFGGTSLERVVDAQIAGSLGDVVVAGTTASPTMIYADGASQALFGAMNTTDAFVISLADDGTLRWWAQYGGTGYDNVVAVARDADGATYVAGNYSGGFSMRNDRDSSGIPIPYADAPTDGVFVVKHELSGRTGWVRTFARNSEFIEAFAAGGDTLFVGGELDDGMVFDDVELTPTTFRQGYVVALSAADGMAQWGRIYGVPENEEGELLRWMTADAEGNVYFSTRTNGGADYGGGAIPLTLGEGFTLVSLTSSAEHRFSRIFSDQYSEGGVNRMRFAGGHLLIAGWSGEGADLGGGALPNVGMHDALALQITPDGAWRWSAVLGSTEFDGASTITSSADGQRVFAVMGLAGTVVIDGTTYGTGGSILVGFDLPGGA
ncbi:hypothetical protein [Sandaracinus amylolyticus]|uniref:Tryptophan synthase alpha chain n=1 Tax=Sandaracinus amylolyticus TaxID=927083 RepID=A0A0F6W8W8_9BACT|nr:hypothetical protein [Sandaracinus amylolyticus]AKF10425.1 Tryptophan synthase alpha chain [Sandaracinus amylolyticus]